MTEGWKLFAASIVIATVAISIVIVGIPLYGQMTSQSTSPIGRISADNTVHPVIDQSQSKSCSAVSTCEASSASLTYAGDDVFVGVTVNTSGAVISNVKDNYGDSYSNISFGTLSGSSLRLYIYSFYSVASSGGLEVWVNTSVSESYTFVWVALSSVRAISPIDAIGSVASNPHSSAVSASVTTTTANDYLLMFLSCGGNEAFTGSGGSSGSYLIVHEAANPSSTAANQSAPSTGSNTVTGTQGASRAYVAVVLAVLPGAVPSAPTNYAQTGATWTTVTYGWTAPRGVIVNYTVIKSSNSGCTSASYVSTTSTSDTVIGLVVGQTRYQKVVAWNTTGESASTACTISETLPGPVTSPSAAAASTTSIAVSWTNPGGNLNNSFVYWEAGSSCSSPTLIVVGSSVSTYTVTGLVTNTQYCFYVRAYDIGGIGNASSTVTAVTASVPSAPTGLTAGSPTVSTIALSWTNPSTGGLVNNTVDQGPSSCSYNHFTSLGSAMTSTTATGLAGATAYCFAIQVWNATGESGLSSSASATTLPSAATLLSISTVTLTTISISWTNPSGSLTDSYVYWEAGSSCSAASQINVGSVATTYTVTGLTTGNLYCFYVEVSSAGGTGAASSIVAGFTAQVPSAPTSLSVASKTATTISLTWLNPAGGGIQNDTVWYGATCGALGTTLSTGGSATSKTVSGLSIATTYCFAVQAYNSTGGSPLSSTLTAETGSYPTAVTSLSISGIGSSFAVLAWTNPPASSLINTTVYVEIGSCAFSGGTSEGAAVTSANVTGLTSATKYCFAIQVWNSTGGSPLEFVNGTTSSEGGGGGGGVTPGPPVIPVPPTVTVGGSSFPTLSLFVGIALISIAAILIVYATSREKLTARGRR
jgi:hypothetical protein